MIEKLRKRAKALRTQGIFLIVFVGCLMITAGWLFFNAADIAARDIRVPDPAPFKKELLSLKKQIKKIDSFIPTSELTDTIKKTEEHLKQVITDMNNELYKNSGIKINYSRMYVTKMDDERSILKILGIDIKLRLKPTNIKLEGDYYIIPSIDDFHMKKIKSYVVDNNKKYENIREISNRLKEQWDSELGRVLKNYDDNKNNLKKYLKRKENLEKLITMSENYKLARQFDIDIEGLPENKDKIKNNSENQMLFIISTNIIRFGPMLIIFFFSRVLLGLYKYSVRLASYYDARADALELIATDFDHEKYNSWVNTLSPDAYDIGANNGKPPADQIIDIMKIITQKSA